MAYAVVVDVPPVEAEVAQRALTTCNAALGADRCAFASVGAVAHWYAVVRVDPERKAVLTIQLYDGSAEGVRVASSALEFKDRDTELERWASAGVVVAALVAAQTAPSPEPAPPPAPVVAPPTVLPKRQPRPTLVALRPVWLRMDLGATGGSEIQSGALRFGALSRLGLAFSEIPAVVFGSAAYTVRGSGTPDLTWFTASLGFGAHVGFGHDRGALDVRTEGVVESVTIHATEGARTDTAQRTRLGPRFGFDLSGYIAKDLALVAGIEAAVLRPGVMIAVGGLPADRLPPFNWGFISAVRYDFR
ncbi:MAG TPA: hypothetical protein VK745_18595 [Polyangiaceae bacterium]|jgi:hypothetical protein|nr:hypothetical protein [Polyangiaceae bacterium]